MSRASPMPRAPARPLVGLARACHPAPTVGVTVLSVLLGRAVGVDGARLVLLAVAVLAGQLVIGWSNDLIDVDRDRSVGRTDKPIATGELTERTAAVALTVAVGAAVVLSLWLGPAAALVHLLLVVGSGCAYNLWFKRNAWSWLPYAVAFGSLPAFTWLAADSAAASGPVLSWTTRADAFLAPGWMMLAGALLGVGAHLVNALPDLADDEAAGIRGLPHRLGRGRARTLAVVIMAAGTLVAVLGPGTPVPGWAWGVLAVVVVAAVASLRVAGKAPFRTAILIALVNVVVLVLRG